MASSSRRRRRRQARSSRVSYGQNSYRVVEAARRPTRVRTRTTASRRVLGAAGWTAPQRQALERLRRLRRRKLSPPRKGRAVRSISLVERLNAPRKRGRSGPCIRRPSPEAAGRARQDQVRSGRGAGSKAQRLANFRVWCS